MQRSRPCNLEVSVSFVLCLIALNETDVFLLLVASTTRELGEGWEKKKYSEPPGGIFLVSPFAHKQDGSWRLPHHVCWDQEASLTGRVTFPWRDVWMYGICTLSTTHFIRSRKALKSKG